MTNMGRTYGARDHALGRLVSLGGLLAAAGCCTHEVVSFHALPAMVCAGQTATVDWSVTGRASLRATRGASDWDEGEVPSKGNRMVAVAQTTRFDITALDANRADGNWTGMKTVQVPKSTDDREVTTTCDATTRRCAGSFALDAATSTLHVRRLSAGSLVQSGHAQPSLVCVSHDGQAPVCVPAGGAVDLDQPAPGTWQLTAELPAGAPLEPTPKLAVHVDFGCP